jgi:hypothetical protein
VLDGHQGRHVKSCSQILVASFAHAGGLVDGRARVKRTRVETGVSNPLAHGHIRGQHAEFGQDLRRACGSDTTDRDEVLEGLSQVAMLRNQSFGLPREQGYTTFEMTDGYLNVSANYETPLRAVCGCMQTVALLAEHLGEGIDPARHCPELKALWRRRLPGNERHPSGELENHRGIHGVGFSPLQGGLGEVVDRPRVDDHDRHTWGPMERNREV